MSQEDTLKKLNSLLLSALQTMFPGNPGIWTHANIRKKSRKRFMDDYQTQAARIIFQKILGKRQTKAKKKKKNDSQNNNDTNNINKLYPFISSITNDNKPNNDSTTTESQLSFVKNALESPTALAHTLISYIPSSPLIYKFHVTVDGCIIITTHSYYISQLIHGFLYCSLCGMFSSGHMGKRNHLQQAHQLTFEHATEMIRKETIIDNELLQNVDASILQKLSIVSHKNHKCKKKKQKNPIRCLELAKLGDLIKLKSLIQDGWDVNSLDHHGSCALHWAAGGGHLDTCKFLVEQKADVNAAQQIDGRNSLHWAARNGHLHIVKWLVDICMIPVDVLTVNGTPPFHWAVWQSHIDVCKWLISAGANPAHENKFGCNAIHWASLKGHIEMCAWLNQPNILGKQIKMLNRNGHSALHKVALKGHTNLCIWLINEVGLNWRHMQEDDEGHSPSEIARIHGHTKLAKLLRKMAVRARYEKRNNINQEVLELEYHSQ